MNAITLHSPWSDLIAIGAKSVETRSWPAPPAAIGQRLAIHSGKTFHTYAHDFLVESEEAQAAFREHGISPYTGLAGDFQWDNDRELGFLENAETRFLFGHTRGCVVAVGTLADCVRMATSRSLSGRFLTRRGWHELTADERAFGDFSDGRYAWVLTDVVRLDPPIPARGYQQIWQWDAPAHVLAALRAADAA